MPIQLGVELQDGIVQQIVAFALLAIGKPRIVRQRGIVSWGHEREVSERLDQEITPLGRR